MFDSKYANLNEEQRRAVDAIDGPVLVIAGPGSGKTEILSLRVLNILKQTDIPPSSILCLTFTDNASLNMQNRLAGLIGSEAYKIAIHTFHSFGQDIINRYPDYFYKGFRFNPADDVTQSKILESVLNKMPNDSILKSFDEEHGYSYVDDVRARIGELKTGGLSPEEFKNIIEANSAYLKEASSVLNNFIEQTSFRRKNEIVINSVPPLISALEAIPADKSTIVEGYVTVKEKILEKLIDAYNKAVDSESKKHITDWKDSVSKINPEGKRVFKDYINIEKSFALAEIYKNYKLELHKEGYFDFSDMIADVSRAMDEHQDLKFNLQEKYQYVLVDEFQDTNGSQMRLLNHLLDAEVNEGRPNIMAVGDDDQSIYKFQGANLDNMENFKIGFRDPEIIVLTKNYRSTPNILSLVRKMVLKGEDRLENKWEEIDKNLVAANKSLENGEIAEKEFPTKFHEFMWVAEEIKKRIDEGEAPKEITVIAPRHKILMEMAKYLDYKGIPVSYDRKKDLFEQKQVMQIINMLRFIDSLNKVGQKGADYLLPEILSYEFFDIPRLDIWKISVEAYSPADRKNQKLWLEVMLSHPDEKIRNIAEFFIELAGFCKIKTGEEIIDMLSGITSVSLGGKEFTSPYKEYYFGKDSFEFKQNEFMDHLIALQSLLNAIRSFEGSRKSLSVADIIDFIDLHEKYKIKLVYQTEFNTAENAVYLSTPHKAKGLEFDTVYAISCSDKDWCGKGKPQKLKFPANIPLSSESDNPDDKLRLFYVTLSRAKRNLYISSHKHSHDGKGIAKLRFLEDKDIYEKPEKPENSAPPDLPQNDFYEMMFNPVKYGAHNTQENALLKGILDGYKLSATHLNNFLDISRGGPRFFMENNLLKFPKKQSYSLSFGSAMHDAIENFHKEFVARAVLPSSDDLLNIFEEVLPRQRLNPQDFEKALEQGRNYLKIYYENRKHDFKMNDIIELDFKNQNVVLEEARITGKLDKIRIDENNNASVTDLKTGKILYKWGNDLKSIRYRDQLVFYKLLVENSRDYSKYTVTDGIMEFLMPSDGKTILLPHSITDSEMAEMKKLIKVVFEKIMNLDFPDISEYPVNNEGKATDVGVKQFRRDLLDGKI